MINSFPNYCQWPVLENCLGCEVHVPHNTCIYRPKKVNIDSLLKVTGCSIREVADVACEACKGYDFLVQLDDDCYKTCDAFRDELEGIEFDNPITHGPPLPRPDQIPDVISPEEVEQMEETD